MISLFTDTRIGLRGSIFLPSKPEPSACTKEALPTTGRAFHLYLTDISKNVEFNKNKTMNDIRKEREEVQQNLKDLKQKYKNDKAPLKQKLTILQEKCKSLGHPNSKEDLSKSLPEFNCLDCGGTYNL